MKKRTEIIGLGVLSAACVAGLMLIPQGGNEPGFDPPTRAARVYVTEDSPLWDCQTMGNRICGSGEIKAEEDALKFLQNMSISCGADGQAAETWVERHPAGESRPYAWYEVLGKCAGRMPQGQ